MRPLLLDLFCGAGGAAMGYHRAGFDVVGVDINPQPNYPFKFHQRDAISVLEDIEAGRGAIDFDAIHASPPCQDHMRGGGHPTHGTGWMLNAVRRMLTNVHDTDGVPWVIENVPGAPMRADYRLCGCQFGLRLRRKRWFETSWDGFAFMEPCHHDGPVPSVVGTGTPSWVAETLGYNPGIAELRECMGIDWMNRKELSQAIPPAYTEYIGTQLLAHVAPADPPREPEA